MARLRVEMIAWHDASKSERKELSRDAMILGSFGAVVYEDAKQVALASEAEHRIDFMSRELDYTMIPKRMILMRVFIGEVDFPHEIKKVKARSNGAVKVRVADVKKMQEDVEKKEVAT